MSRLQTEFDRLFAIASAVSEADGAPAARLLDSMNRCRALVLDIGRPVEWSLVAALALAVQDALHLPAPAIAISGGPSFQLWWSFKDAVPAHEAAQFLNGVRGKFLAELPEARVQIFPAPGDAQGEWRHARPVPEQVLPDQWSAFVAPGLAPVFEQTPWLDFPPNEEGQADLLRAIDSVSLSQWQEAQRRLGVEHSDEAGQPGVARSGSDGWSGAGSAPTPGAAQGIAGSARRAAPESQAHGDASGAEDDPRRFLLRIMNDNSVDLALRVEAAKALLPYTVER